MADRSRLPLPPTATPVVADRGEFGVPTAAPVDDRGIALIPELAGRAPTHNESVILSGEPIATASTNVKEFWYMWQERRLFVRFLDQSLYVYRGVPLAVVVRFLETDSHGRFVHNYLTNDYPYDRLAKGDGRRRPAQVLRLRPN